MTLAKIANLTDSEATIELLRLCGEAGEFERRLIKYSITERLDDAVRTDDLCRLVESMPMDERRAQLYWARRWVSMGQSQYGTLDPKTDRRDFQVQAGEESPDGFFYFVADMAKNGRTDKTMLVLWTEIMRRGTERLLAKGAI